MAMGVTRTARDPKTMARRAAKVAELASVSTPSNACPSAEVWFTGKKAIATSSWGSWLLTLQILNLTVAPAQKKAGTEVPAFQGCQASWLPRRLFAAGHRDLIAAVAAIAAGLRSENCSGGQRKGEDCK